jgi:hypothetical protein
MRLRSCPSLRRIASGLMLAAMAAFVQQAAMIIVSQAAAAAGSMPEPAVILGGSVHFHDNLAGHVHAHGGDNAAGHVHTAPDPDHSDSDELAATPFCCLSCTSAVLPVAGACALPVDVVTAEQHADDRLAGVEPDGLSRPPSTPSIA